MKNTALSFLFVLLSVSGFSQTVKNDAEYGNEAIYQAQCWELNGVAISNHASAIVGGKFSFRSIALQKESLTDSYVETPWIKLKSGHISLKTRLDGAAGGNRRIVAQYIPVDNQTQSEGIPVVFATYEFSNPIHHNTKLHDVSFAVPAQLVDGKHYKIRFSFTGTGGSATISLDDLVVPGEYASDPSKGCQPLIAEKDSDGDGIADSEDEFPADPYRAFTSHFPGQDFGTLMFEDLWPGIGDYDFNDLVVDFRVEKVTDAKNGLVEVIIDLKTRAIGAGFKNGFGIEFSGISPAKVLAVTGTQIGANSIHSFAPNGLEAGNEWATIIPYDNAFHVLPHSGGGVTGVNTESIGPKQAVYEQRVTVFFKKEGTIASGGPVRPHEISLENFNPFLIRNQDRTIEIHLPGKPPTRHANQALFGTIDDDSKAAEGIYYLSKRTNLPWALQINQSIPYMIEKNNISKGFLKFEEWAISKGEAFPEWYLDQPDLRNNSLIY